jgi:hypothetical protein
MLRMRLRCASAPTGGPAQSMMSTMIMTPEVVHIPLSYENGRSDTRHRMAINAKSPQSHVLYYWSVEKTAAQPRLHHN